MSDAGTRRPAFVIDETRCIGCWACAIACRAKNEADDEWWVRVESQGGSLLDTSAGVFPDLEKRYRPVIDRCGLTPDAVDPGDPPACARACPTAALRVGDMRDPGSDESLESAEVVPPKAQRPVEVWYLSVPARRQRRSGGQRPPQSRGDAHEGST